MYTHQEFERYSAMLRESGITDETQIQKILDFVYRMSVIIADEYEDNLRRSHGTKEKESENKVGSDQRGQEGCRDMDTSEHPISGGEQSESRDPGKSV